MALGLRIGIELVVAILVATLLGWGIDRWLGTSPWVAITMFFLGVAAGMVNVYRAVAGIQTPVGMRRPLPIDPEILIETGRIDDQRVAIPTANRISIRTRRQIPGMNLRVHIYDAHGVRSADIHDVNPLKLR
jgi:hypothetical protein